MSEKKDDFEMAAADVLGVKPVKPKNNVDDYLSKYSRGKVKNERGEMEDYDIDPELVRPLISQESSGNPKAKSHKNAQGLMQLIPATAKRFGVNNPYDPEENVKGGTAYLGYLTNFWKRRGKEGDDLNRHVLASYNAGEGAVEKHGIDKVYKFSNSPNGKGNTTGEYVDKILGQYNKKKSSDPFEEAAKTITGSGKTRDDFEMAAEEIGNQPTIQQQPTPQPVPPTQRTSMKPVPTETGSETDAEGLKKSRQMKIAYGIATQQFGGNNAALLQASILKSPELGNQYQKFVSGFVAPGEDPEKARLDENVSTRFIDYQKRLSKAAQGGKIDTQSEINVRAEMANEWLQKEQDPLPPFLHRALLNKQYAPEELQTLPKTLQLQIQQNEQTFQQWAKNNRFGPKDVDTARDLYSRLSDGDIEAQKVFRKYKTAIQRDDAARQSQIDARTPAAPAKVNLDVKDPNAIKAHLNWHYGMTAQEFVALTPAQKRTVLLNINHLVAIDNDRKARGEQIQTDAATQNKNRNRLGLSQPSPQPAPDAFRLGKMRDDVVKVDEFSRQYHRPPNAIELRRMGIDENYKQPKPEEFTKAAQDMVNALGGEAKLKTKLDRYQNEAGPRSPQTDIAADDIRQLLGMKQTGAAEKWAKEARNTLADIQSKAGGPLPAELAVQVLNFEKGAEVLNDPKAQAAIANYKAEEQIAFNQVYEDTKARLSSNRESITATTNFSSGPNFRGKELSDRDIDKLAKDTAKTAIGTFTALQYLEQQKAIADEVKARDKRLAEMSTLEAGYQRAIQIPVQFVDTIASVIQAAPIFVQPLAKGLYGKEKLKIEDHPVYQLGEALRSGPRWLLGSNKDVEQTFSAKAIGSLGQVGAFALGGWATGGSKLITAFLGTAMTAPDIYQEARSLGANEDQASLTALWGSGALGWTELIGLRETINGVAGTAKQQILSKIIREAVVHQAPKEFVENSLQELGQEFFQGIITGKGRTAWELFEAAAIGGFAGPVGAVTTNVGVPVLKGMNQQGLVNTVKNIVKNQPLNSDPNVQGQRNSVNDLIALANQQGVEVDEIPPIEIEREFGLSKSEAIELQEQAIQKGALTNQELADTLEDNVQLAAMTENQAEVEVIPNDIPAQIEQPGDLSVPEASATVKSQLDSVRRGEKPLAAFPQGSDIKDVDIVGLERFITTDQNGKEFTLIYDPNLVSSSQEAELAFQADPSAAMGYSIPLDQADGTVVTAIDSQGKEVESRHTNQEAKEQDIADLSARPDVTKVVEGGQGLQEAITEARIQEQFNPVIEFAQTNGLNLQEALGDPVEFAAIIQNYNAATDSNIDPADMMAYLSREQQQAEGEVKPQTLEEQQVSGPQVGNVYSSDKSTENETNKTKFTVTEVRPDGNIVGKIKSDTGTDGNKISNERTELVLKDSPRYEELFGKGEDKNELLPETKQENDAQEENKEGPQSSHQRNKEEAQEEKRPQPSDVLEKKPKKRGKDAKQRKAVQLEPEKHSLWRATQILAQKQGGLNVQNYEGEAKLLPNVPGLINKSGTGADVEDIARQLFDMGYFGDEISSMVTDGEYGHIDPHLFLEAITADYKHYKENNKKGRYHAAAYYERIDDAVSNLTKEEQHILNQIERFKADDRVLSVVGNLFETGELTDEQLEELAEAGADYGFSVTQTAELFAVLAEDAKTAQTNTDNTRTIDDVNQSSEEDGETGIDETEPEGDVDDSFDFGDEEAISDDNLFDAVKGGAESDEDLFDLVKNEPTSKPVQTQKVSTSGKAAVKETAKGIESAAKGLAALFGVDNPETFGSSGVFNEETYKKAVQHFKVAAQHFKDAYTNIKEFAVLLGKTLRESYGFTNDMFDRMKPYLIKFMRGVESGDINLNEENTDATSDSGDVESDSTGDNASNGVGEGNIQSQPKNTRQLDPNLGRSIDRQQNGPKSNNAIDISDAVSSGESGIDEISEPSSEFDQLPEDQNILGSVDDSGEGVGLDDNSDRDSETATDRVQRNNQATENRLELQRNAASITIKPNDLDNIRETLPYLFPAQQEDVKFAEQRFSKPDGTGVGVLFTNSTGTGKTAVAMGIAARFIRQGKDNVLFITRSQQLVSDAIGFGERLGLRFKALSDTKDNGGSGPVATTHDNVEANKVLADRHWDLIIVDESHYLKMSESGKDTLFLDALRGLTFHPDAVSARFQMLEREWLAEYKELSEREQIARQSEYMARVRLHEENAKRVQENQSLRPRVAFFSASPFSYQNNIDYAEGYLFNYTDGLPENYETGGYNQPSPSQRFMIRHFGYRMRSGKLTKPAAGVDSDIAEMDFNRWLQDQGVLTGRVLDSDTDYERQFVVAKSSIGQEIDRGMKIVSPWDNKNKYAPLGRLLQKYWRRNQPRFVLEAIKAQEAVALAEKHIELGRKVIIFHDYKAQKELLHPFHFDTLLQAAGINESTIADKDTGLTWRGIIDSFQEEHGDLVSLPLNTLENPLALFKRKFGEAARFYNGDTKKTKQDNQKQKAITDFNDDNSDVKVLVVQTAAGREGISLHDITGQFQRALLVIGIPTQPISLLQIEGRIRRIGSITDAIINILTTATSFERNAYATQMGEKVNTAENLAMGHTARILRQSILDAYNEPLVDYDPSTSIGKGGKVNDARVGVNVNPFDRAIHLHSMRLKNSKTRADREGTDFYRTAEPVAFKMAQWADIRPNEIILEPSAGDGGIVQFIPQSNNSVVAVEPSYELASMLRQKIQKGDVIERQFEDYSIHNKHDVIIMNPPFGMSGATARDHFVKAIKHLKENGRIIAIVPEGPAADKKFEEAFADPRLGLQDVFVVAEISLPAIAFNQSGTSVHTRLIIADKHTEPSALTELQPTHKVDLTHIDGIQGHSASDTRMKQQNALFSELRDLEISPRIIHELEQDEAVSKEPETELKATNYKKFEAEHKGTKFYAIAPKKKIPQFKEYTELAERYDGKYYRMNQVGKNFGWWFKSEAARDTFEQEINLREQANNSETGAGELSLLAGTAGLLTLGFGLVSGNPWLIGTGAAGVVGITGYNIYARNRSKLDIDPNDPFYERELRLEAARGIRPASVIKAAYEAGIKLKNAFTRHQIELNVRGDMVDALVGDTLRVLEQAPNFAIEKANIKLAQVLFGKNQNDMLDQKQLKLMANYLIAQDLLRSIEEGLYDQAILDGKPLPFGFKDEAEVASYVDHKYKQINNDPSGKVVRALQRRQELTSAVTFALVDEGFLNEDSLADDRYYHRQVLKYFNDKDVNFSFVGQGQDVRTKSKGFQHERVGSLDDFNTAWQEAEFEWVSQAYTLLENKRALGKLKENADIAPALKKEAKARNFDTAVDRMKKAHVEGLLQIDPTLTVQEQEKAYKEFDPFKDLRQKKAIAFNQLRKLASQGLLDNFGGTYQAVIDAMNQGTSAPTGLLFGFLNELASQGNADPGTIQARTIFAAMRDQNERINNALGKDKLTWKGLMKEAHPNYVIWRPSGDNYFAIAFSKMEHMLSDALTQSKHLQEEDIQDILMRAKLVEEWAIPANVAAALEDYKDKLKLPSAATGTYLAAYNAWKQYILLNPIRASRYMLNNVTGDVDIVIAAEPAMFLNPVQWPRTSRLIVGAMRDLHRYMNKSGYQGIKGYKRIDQAIIDELDDGFRRAVLNSGMTINEIPDISTSPVFREILETKPKYIFPVFAAFKAYWDKISTFNNWRENVMRLAMWRHYKEQVAEKHIHRFGASSKPEMDNLYAKATTDEDFQAIAAKLARELVGDYGNISVAGQWLRRYMIPFFSWQELNAPRYVRLLKNALYEQETTSGKAQALAGVAVGAGIKTGVKVTTNLAALTVGMNIIYIMSYLWNHRDEETEKAFNQLRDEGIGNVLILGKDAQGEIKYIRIEGAFSDALRWFAAHNYIDDIKDLSDGDKTWTNVGTEAAKAPFDRFGTSIAPHIKLTGESLFGYKVYPRLFQKGDNIDPRKWKINKVPIRDKTQHLFEGLGMGDFYNFYRTVSGRIPIPHATRSVSDFFLTYHANPDEVAYWKMFDEVRLYKQAKGLSSDAGGEPDDRANAAYYFKKALQYGNNELAAKWLEEYKRLGGTDERLEASARASNPLSKLNKANKELFVQSLSPDKKKIFDAAMRFYEKTFGKLKDIDDEGGRPKAKGLSIRKPSLSIKPAKRGRRETTDDLEELMRELRNK